MFRSSLLALMFALLLALPRISFCQGAQGGVGEWRPGGLGEEAREELEVEVGFRCWRRRPVVESKSTQTVWSA